MYQKLTGLPKGVYLLKAAVSAQSQATALCENGTYLYGNDIKIMATSVEPVFMETYIPVDADTLELGLYMSEDNGNNWVAMDNVSLKYYGNSLESYKNMVTMFSNWKDGFDGLTVAKSLAEDIDSNISELTSATTEANAVESYRNIVNDITEAYSCAEAYRKLAELVDFVYYEAGVDYSPLNDYVDICDKMVNEATALTAEVVDATNKLNSLLEEGKRNQLKPGSDATSLLGNHDFTESSADVPYNGFGNWNISGTNDFASNGKPNVAYGVAEVWVNAFELSQTIDGLQNGVYKLSTKAYYRYPEKNGNPYDSYLSASVNDADIATLFANDSEQGIPNIFSGRQNVMVGTGKENTDNDGGFTPNDKAAAAKYFEKGLYGVETYGIVTDGKLTVGIHGKNDNTWVVWAPFSLEFEGKDASILSGALIKVISEYTPLLNEKQGAEEKEALSVALVSANNSVAGKDGNAMFNAYSDLQKAAANSKACVEGYKSLEQINALLANTIDLYQDDADANIVSQAIALNNSVSTALSAGSITGGDVIDKVDEVRKTIVSLKASAASDDNAVDMTDLIANPNFEGNSLEGWTVDTDKAKCGLQYDIFEGYNGNFDIHQLVSNAPQGTYKIEMMGFYRRGTSDNANSAYENDSTILAASLYANGNDSVSISNIVCIDELAMSAGEGNWKSISVNDDMYYYPNDRATARNRFDIMQYKNELYTNVGEDGLLRIGVRNTNSIADDWTTLANFKLMYYGKNSKYAATTLIKDIDATSSKTTEIYTMNGMRVNRLVKGLNIIKTNEGGKITIHKLLVR